ncbi:flagellar basal body-associated protein FliL [Ornithinibacillus salinisoli]|uniref:Flagellar protein FliL n=1 Tax=Ornithinibacillus salinisoli TaxID=1848459 RepID=A0ABW4W001_9BACI
MKLVNNIVKTMITSLIAILVLGGIAAAVVLYVLNDKNGDGEQTIDDIVEYSYTTPEITTDLNDGSFVRIQFEVITDSKKAKSEIEKRDFQVKNILIKELAKMDEEDFKTGLPGLEDVVMAKLNEVMTEGTVADVYTIQKILQ